MQRIKLITIYSSQIIQKRKKIRKIYNLYKTGEYNREILLDKSITAQV